MNRVFHSYGEFKGDIRGRRNGALIATQTGTAVAYAIFNLQDRGVMFIDPQTKVYQGMIVGEHNRPNDLEINILKGKQLTKYMLKNFSHSLYQLCTIVYNTLPEGKVDLYEPAS